MLLENLRRELCMACRGLARHIITSAPGSVSGIDRELGLMAITPAPVPDAGLEPAHVALMNLDGQPVEGALPPSPDALTHLAIYNVLKNVGGIVHAHSRYSTMFAQAGRPIPCLGTTHADRFRGEIPITRALRKPEIEGNYAHNTGLVILERFARLNPMDVPAVLLIHHGAFAWGQSIPAAADNFTALEEIAFLAFGTLQLNPAHPPIPAILQDRHLPHSQDAWPP